MENKNYSKRALVQSIIGFFTGMLVIGFILNILALISASKGIKQIGKNAKATAAIVIAIVGMSLSLAGFAYATQNASSAAKQVAVSQDQTNKSAEQKDNSEPAATTETQQPAAQTETTADTQAAAESETTAAEPSLSLSQRNAVAKAKQYLAVSAFSRQGLIKQLQFEGFEQADAEYGVDNAGADWNEQAGKKAQDYLNLSAFSKDGLSKQLKYEGFTDDEIQAGLTAVGY